MNKYVVEELGNEYSYSVIANAEDLKVFINSQSLKFSSFENSTIFLSEDFILTWIEYYHSYIHEIMFVVFYQQDEVIGFSPLYVKKNKTREIRFLCTGEREEDEVFSEYLDFLIKKGKEDQVLSLFMAFLSGSDKKWDQFVIDNYLPDSFINLKLLPFLNRKKYSIIKHDVGLRYYLKLPETIEKFYADKKGSFYSGLKRKYRKLIKVKDIKCEVISDVNLVSEYIDAMKILHNKRWKSEDAHGVFESDVFFQFHKAVSKKIIKDKYLFLLVIRDKNEVVSVIYGYIYNGVLSFYQSGYLGNEYNKLSIGGVSHLFAIEYAIEQNLLVYDFMLDSFDSYKSKFKCDTSSMCTSIVYKPSISGWFSWLSKYIYQLLVNIKMKVFVF